MLNTTDIDECAEVTHRCEHNCSNTDGSYACRCAFGYRIDSNGYSCNGIILHTLAYWKVLLLVTVCQISMNVLRIEPAAHRLALTPMDPMNAAAIWGLSWTEMEGPVKVCM